jgi:uncharacterized protein (DUF1778 family)
MKRAAKERSVSNTETRNEKLDLRLTPSAKRTRETAALAAHRSVSEFVLESALARAEQTLPDRDASACARSDGKLFRRLSPRLPVPRAAWQTF